MRESHCAVAKEAKRAMCIDYENLPRAPGRFLKLKLEKRKHKLCFHSLHNRYSIICNNLHCMTNASHAVIRNYIFAAWQDLRSSLLLRNRRLRRRLISNLSQKNFSFTQKTRARSYEIGLARNTRNSQNHTRYRLCVPSGGVQA